ncbi:MAG: aminodeoxychorismate/anthranilate synthase component II [Proteobacteria bacterium]|nr:aminodeoxychorismate/anthranilate synthase component II [Pseudomonadota bacterium]
MLLIVDNYDSFTFNLYQMLGGLHPRIEVVRNDRITVEEISAAKFDGIVLSPGPGTPDDSGVCFDILRELDGTLPILGVCLGHQAICQMRGAKVVRAELPVHGKPSDVTHDGKGLFAGMPTPFVAGRYHSLVVDPATLPDDLVVTASTDDGEIMAVRHVTHPTVGVQFHPESILTPDGERLLANFLGMLAG